MKIIDTRFRPATRETLQGILHNPLYQEFSKATHFADRPEATLDEEVAMLRGLGVEKAIVTGRDIQSTVDTPSTNPGMLESITAYPDFFIGFYGVDPHRGMSALRDLRALVHNGVKGMSIDPAMSHLPVDDAKYYPFYALCCEENIPVAITTGCSIGMPGVYLEHHAPWRIDRVATDFPELRLVISHGAYPWVSESIGVTMRHTNIFIDFSACTHLPQLETYLAAANGPLISKVLFASAHPFEPIQSTLELYKTLPLSNEARTHIMYTNAVRLLGL